MALRNSKIDPINTFLHGIYYIPNYQREYSWEEPELLDFWEDLNSIIDDSDAPAHFFGQIVVHDDEEQKKKYIIDGQQRTITSTIFMRVLQTFYDKIYKSDDLIEASYKVSDITTDCIGRKGELHLRLGELDNEYFREKIQLGIPDETKKEKKKSHERIRTAFFFFRDKIKEKIDTEADGQSQFQYINKYYNALANRFNVLYMEATELEEAFVIFETLNARGKELETADLLKNCIFSKTKDIEMSQKRWDSMINQLDKADPTKFIRHYWNSSREFTRDKALYRKISREVVNPRASRDLLHDIDKLAQCYHDMSYPEENIGFMDDKLIRSLKSLKMLKASSFYPIVLSMKRMQTYYSEVDIRKVVEVIEIYVYRNFTICGKVANKAEIFFADIAKKIYNETYSTPDEICQDIRKGIVSDQDFQTSFELWTGSKSAKDPIRYTLRKIHKHLDSLNEISVDNNDVQIEHIMPEDNSQWDIDQEEHDTYLWRLGNLALISGKINMSISNKPFDQKKQQYAASTIKPNEDIANSIHWGKDEIENRQKRLAAYALKIWK